MQLNIDSKGQSHFDYEALRQNMLEDEEAIGVMLSYLKTDLLKEDIAELQEAIDVRDAEQVYALAHKIKGTALSSSMPILTELSIQLESIQPMDYEQATSLLAKIHKEYQQIMEAVFSIDH